MITPVGRMRQPKATTFCAATTVFLLLAGCTPQVQTLGRPIHQARLSTLNVTTPDGATLPVTRWTPNGKTQAVIIALHGFTDYRHAFALPAAIWQQAGITTIAFDQRGFGAGPQPGIWGGIDAYRADAVTALAVARRDYPDTPVFLLGESMGGAVAIVTLTAPNLPNALRPDGVILVAPALLPGPLPPWQKRLLSAVSHLMPWAKSGRRGIRALPTNNRGLLKEMAHDPLVQKEVRLDQVYGLIQLMEQATPSLADIQTPTLLVFGDQDRIVPRPAWENALRIAAADGDNLCGWQVTGGYHMILRDLAAEKRAKGIADWILALGNPPDCG